MIYADNAATTKPSRTAPAVWELDGPTMTGPMMSKMFIRYSVFYSIFFSIASITVFNALILAYFLSLDSKMCHGA